MYAGGLISYFGLDDWWKSLSLREQEIVQYGFDKVQQGSIGVDDERPLTGKTIYKQSGIIVIGRSESSYWLLHGIASSLNSIQFHLVARKVIDQAMVEVSRHRNIIDKHFVYTTMIQVYYRGRDIVPNGLDIAIKVCKEHIALSKSIYNALKKEHETMFLHLDDAPELIAYPIIGIVQLAIIYEKQHEYKKAALLCAKGIDDGWEGDLEKRLQRCLAKERKRLELIAKEKEKAKQIKKKLKALSQKKQMPKSPTLRVVLTAQQQSTPEGEEFVRLCLHVTKGGSFTREDVVLLYRWLRTRTESTIPAIRFLAGIMERVASDKQVTAEECDELYQGIEKVLPPNFRQRVMDERRALQSAMSL